MDAVDRSAGSADYSAVLADLAELGEIVCSDRAALDEVRSDYSGHRTAAPPLAVVEARTVADVQATMRLASRHGIPVVPRGAGTGLAGAATAGAGEIVLSTRAMTAIRELAVPDELVVVEPGLINADLNRMLAPHGLWWAPDPASRAISTVGGNIATNAGGLLCAKYGVTREAVLGLGVVLADGTFLRVGHRSVKGVTGFDLTALLIGSEGTLGVIVEATLRLRPLPRGPRVTIGGLFPDVVSAARAAAAIGADGLRPAILELLDARAVAALGSYFQERGFQERGFQERGFRGQGLPGRGPVSGATGVGLAAGLAGAGGYLLAQTDGGSAEDEAARIADLIMAAGGAAEIAPDEETGEHLFDIRRAFHPALEARGAVLIEDVAVPRSALPQMFAEITRVEREYGVEIPTVAHAGDGNLHPNFVIPRDAVGDAVGHAVSGAASDPGHRIPEEVRRAADDLFASCLRLGGTLTGEHGVGVLKRERLRDELGDDVLALQRRVKAAFDPRGILNPGKAI